MNEGASQGKMVSEMDAYLDIAQAVVVQACRDYVKALVNKNLKLEREVEAFFRSNAYKLYSPDVESKFLKDKLKVGAKEFLKLFEQIIEDGKLSPGRKITDNVAVCPICGGSVMSRWRILSNYKDLDYIAVGYIVGCSSCYCVKKQVVAEVHGKNANDYKNALLAHPIAWKDLPKKRVQMLSVQDIQDMLERNETLLQTIIRLQESEEKVKNGLGLCKRRNKHRAKDRQTALCHRKG